MFKRVQARRIQPHKKENTPIVYRKMEKADAEKKHWLNIIRNMFKILSE